MQSTNHTRIRLNFHAEASVIHEPARILNTKHEKRVDTPSMHSALVLNHLNADDDALGFSIKFSDVTKVIQGWSFAGFAFISFLVSFNEGRSFAVKFAEASSLQLQSPLE